MCFKFVRLVRNEKCAESINDQWKLKKSFGQLFVSCLPPKLLLSFLDGSTSALTSGRIRLTIFNSFPCFL